MRRVIVYTALYGAHQPYLYEPIGTVPDWVSLRAFVDPTIGAPEHSQWTCTECPGVFVDARMSAKWFRLNPDILFPEPHTFSIWVDPVMQINIATLVQACETAFAGADIATFLHPERNNIDDELQATLAMEKDERIATAMRAQVASYKAEGLPPIHGLRATGILARKPTAANTAFNRLWLAECVRWSYQDQLSFPYVCWKLGVRPGVIPGSIYETPVAKQYR